VDKFGGGGTGTIIKAYPEKVLPKNVTKIIFSDTDTIWVRDIYELWKVFDTMNPEQLYGMAIEWSFWYWVRFPNLRFSQDATGLPAPRCGLNAGLHLLPPRIEFTNSAKYFRPPGLLLLHVERMRAWNWTENWRVQVTEQLTMGDQDVYNGIANQNPYVQSPPIQKQKNFFLTISPFKTNLQASSMGVEFTAMAFHARTT